MYFMHDYDIFIRVGVTVGVGVGVGVGVEWLVREKFEGAEEFIEEFVLFDCSGLVLLLVVFVLLLVVLVVLFDVVFAVVFVVVLVVLVGGAKELGGVVELVTLAIP